MHKRLDNILLRLEDNKALDIVSINVTEKTSLTDYLIFATGTSNRHIGSISEAIKQKLKKLNIPLPSVAVSYTHLTLPTNGCV